MARRPNYNFEKRQKEIEKQKKKDEKAEKKRLRKEAGIVDDDIVSAADLQPGMQPSDDESE